MHRKETSGKGVESSPNLRFKLIDAIKIIEDHPFDTEEERWARFPESMPSWDKMKFERNALASILSKKAFDSKFNSKITTLTSEKPSSNTVFSVTYEEQAAALEHLKGEKRFDALVTEIPKLEKIPEYVGRVYLIENAYTCRKLVQEDGGFAVTRETTSLEKVIGDMFRSVYTESVAHFIEESEDPAIEALHNRYQALLQPKYRVDSILDELVRDFEDDKAYWLQKRKQFFFFRIMQLAVEYQFGQGQKIDFNFKYVLEEGELNGHQIIPGKEISYRYVLQEMYDQADLENISSDALYDIIVSVLTKYEGYQESKVKELAQFYEDESKRFAKIAEIENQDKLIAELGSFVEKNYAFFTVDPMVDFIRISPNSHIQAGFSTGIEQINATYFIANSITKRRYLLEHPESLPQLYIVMNEINQQKIDDTKKNIDPYVHKFNEAEAENAVALFLEDFKKYVLPKIDGGEIEEINVDAEAYSSEYFLLYVEALKRIQLPVDQDVAEALVATNYHNLAKLARDHLVRFREVGELTEEQKNATRPGVLWVDERRSREIISLNEALLAERKSEAFASATTFCPALPTGLIKDMFIVYQRAINTVRHRILEQS